MTETKVGRISAIVDEAATRSLYMGIPFLKSTDSARANFLSNLHLRQAAMNVFFEPLGINIYKCSGLWVPDVNPFRQCATYCGYYPLVGIIPNIDTLGDPENIDSAWHAPKETNFGFQLWFSHEEMQLRIDFCVDFPWIFDPPITIGRYINRNKLPDRWRTLCTTIIGGERK